MNPTIPVTERKPEVDSKTDLSEVVLVEIKSKDYRPELATYCKADDRWIIAGVDDGHKLEVINWTKVRRKTEDLPTGWLGNNFSEMTKDEIVNAFFCLWREKERIRKELIAYERVITNRKYHES